MRMRRDAVGIAMLLMFAASVGGCGGAEEEDEEGGWTSLWGQEGSEQGHAVGSDGDGNVYMAGEARYAVGNEKDPFGWQSHMVAAKFGPDGQRRWVERFGTSSFDRVDDAVVDEDDNMYLVGSVDEALPGESHGGDSDGFVGKIGPRGDSLWFDQFSGRSNDAVSEVVLTDGGDVILGGTTFSELVGSNESYDKMPFLARYSPSGERKKLWSPGEWGKGTRSSSLAIDDDNQLYLAGTTDESLGDQQVSDDLPDAFLAKTTLDGEVSWVRVLSIRSPGQTPKVVLDGQDRPYLVSRTNGDFAGQEASSDEVLSDLAVAGYTTSGERRWARLFGSEKNDVPHDAVVDGSGRLRVVGYTQGAPGGRPPSRARDGIVVTWSTDGQRQSVRYVGRSGSEVYGAGTARDGGLLITGETRGGMGEPFGGAVDAFVQKWKAGGE